MEEVSTAFDINISKYLNLSESIYVCLDENACVVFANTRCCQLLGITLESLIGRNWIEEYIPKEQYLKTKKWYKDTFIQKSFVEEEYESEILTNGDKRHLIRWKSQLHEHTHDVLYMICAGTDITCEKKQALELQEQKDFLRMVLDENPNIIIVKDYEGRFVLCNQALAMLYNTTTEDLIGKSDADFNANKDQVNMYLENVQEIMRSGKSRVVFEESTDAKTGQVRFFQSLKKPIYNKLGQRQILVIASDITPMKEAQQKLKKNEQILYHNSKMAAMGEMLENIAHQWRQPLSLISTAASNVKFQNEFMEGVDEQTLVESLDSILKASRYLSQTIDDFRDFFKPDRKRKRFKINTVYEKAKALMESKFKTQDIIFVETISDAELLGFENELVQVFMNILSNAKDALEKNTEKQKSYIFVSIKHDKEWIYINIKDNANGIPLQIISKVFDPYFSTKSSSKGTGIGLYMSEEIICKHMSGFIDVCNETFEYDAQKFTGASFSIRIPKE